MRSIDGPVVVGVDDSPGAAAAITWAVDDARARKAPLRIVYAYRWELTYGRTPMYFDVPETDLSQPREEAERVVGRAIAAARDIDAGLDITGEAVDGDAARALIDESSQAAVMVVGSRHHKALGSTILGSVGGAVAARSQCPVIVVRGPAGLPEEHASVLVGVDGTEASEPVLEFAFEHASRHGVDVRPVLCWHPDLLATMMWRPEPPAPQGVEAWLSETIAGWRERYPDVAVHPGVVREHPVAGLVLAASSQYLLVVGSRGRHALAGTLLGSVSQGVLHHATCPVAVVPVRET